MLRVTVEVVPEGNEDAKRTIGSIEICNVSHVPPDDDAPPVDYVATLFGHDGREHNRCSVSHASQDRWQMLVARVLSAFGYKP